MDKMIKKIGNCNKNYQQNFDEKLKERFITTEKNSMKHYYLKKKIFIVT